MRGLDEGLTTGERVAWYRRRRGLSQAVLAGLVGRTEDWLSKIENGRAPLDRLSVISKLADALDVSLGDLIGGPQLVDWPTDARLQGVSTLRRAVMSSPSPTADAPGSGAVNGIEAADRLVSEVWSAYQDARFGYVIHRVPAALKAAQSAAASPDPQTARRAQQRIALVYQAAAATLTKLGEGELAWICSDRGQRAADESGRPEIAASLARSVAHSLITNGHYGDALAVLEASSARLRPLVSTSSPVAASLYGSLFLVAAMAAARAEDPTYARSMLDQADRTARQLGSDRNDLWTAFGPTNVSIHRISVAMELGDVQVAADQGPDVDVSGMPVERRVRHHLEVARALNATNRDDRGLGTLLSAEVDAPEQVRHHFVSRHLVTSWLRNERVAASPELQGLAQRLHVA